MTTLAEAMKQLNLVLDQNRQVTEAQQKENFDLMKLNLELEKDKLSSSLSDLTKEHNELKEDFEIKQDSLEDITGTLYKLDDLNSSYNAESVISSIVNPIFQGAQDEIDNTQKSVNEYKNAISVIDKKLKTSQAIEKFYTGAGSYTGGSDPKRYDIGDFTDEQLNEYLEAMGVADPDTSLRTLQKKKHKYYEDARLIALNMKLKEQEISDLQHAETEYKSSLNTQNPTNIKNKMSNLDIAVQQMLEKPVASTYANFLTNAVMGYNELLNLQTEIEKEIIKLDDSDITTIDAYLETDDNMKNQYLALTKKLNHEYYAFGNMITNISDMKMMQFNINVGKNYFEAMERYRSTMNTKNIDDVALFTIYDQIHKYASGVEMQFKEGLITEEEFNTYKSNIESLVGIGYNTFMQDQYPLLERAADNKQKFARDLALITMGEVVKEEIVPETEINDIETVLRIEDLNPETYDELVEDIKLNKTTIHLERKPIDGTPASGDYLGSNEINLLMNKYNIGEDELVNLSEYIYSEQNRNKNTDENKKEIDPPKAKGQKHLTMGAATYSNEDLEVFMKLVKDYSGLLKDLNLNTAIALDVTHGGDYQPEWREMNLEGLSDSEQAQIQELGKFRDEYGILLQDLVEYTEEPSKWLKEIVVDGTYYSTLEGNDREIRDRKNRIKGLTTKFNNINDAINENLKEITIDGTTYTQRKKDGQYVGFGKDFYRVLVDLRNEIEDNEAIIDSLLLKAFRDFDPDIDDEYGLYFDLDKMYHKIEHEY